MTTGKKYGGDTPRATRAEPENEDDFHARLNIAAGDISYRKLGRMTDTHPETVRRYMQGQSPSASFLTNLCQVLGISGEWLLTGRGPMTCTEMRSHALGQANPAELMTAMANMLNDLCDRLDRLERFVLVIESRLRSGSGESEAFDGVRAGNMDSMRTRQDLYQQHEQSNRGFESKTNSKGQLSRGTPQSDAPGGTSAKRIRDAIAKRTT